MHPKPRGRDLEVPFPSLRFLHVCFSDGVLARLCADYGRADDSLTGVARHHLDRGGAGKRPTGDGENASACDHRAVPAVACLEPRI